MIPVQQRHFLSLRSCPKSTQHGPCRQFLLPCQPPPQPGERQGSVTHFLFLLHSAFELHILQMTNINLFHLNSGPHTSLHRTCLGKFKKCLQRYFLYLITGRVEADGSRAPHSSRLIGGPHSGREAPAFIRKQVIRTTDTGRTLVYDSRGPELHLKPLTGQVLWQTSMISAP